MGVLLRVTLLTSKTELPAIVATMHLAQPLQHLNLRALCSQQNSTAGAMALLH
jgi:hypothetical protein